MAREENIAPDEYYHVLNRGILGNNIFRDDADRRRFLFLLFYFQSHKIVVTNVSEKTKEFKKVLQIEKLTEKIVENRDVEVICFVLMDNHFHLCLKEVTVGGISKYMQRILNAYTKYFNTRYEQKGHIFQGPYKLVHVEGNDQLLYLSAYIHRNPRELPRWRNKEKNYWWSSYQDYVGKNRWGKLLCAEVISNQFKSQKEYEDFLKSSGAKATLDEQLLLEE